MGDSSTVTIEVPISLSETYNITVPEVDHKKKRKDRHSKRKREGNDSTNEDKEGDNDGNDGNSFDYSMFGGELDHIGALPKEGSKGLVKDQSRGGKPKKQQPMSNPYLKKKWRKGQIQGLFITLHKIEKA